MEKTPRVELSSGRTLNFKYAEADKNKETVVFIHGLGRDLSYWDYHVARLNEYGVGTLRVDLHGHGKTPDQHGSVIPAKDQVDDVASLICQLDIKRVRIVGHSYGGYVALVLGADSRLSDRLTGVDAWMPFLRHLGFQTSEEIVEAVDGTRNLHPLHSIALMIWHTLVRAFMRDGDKAEVRTNTGIGAAGSARRLGAGAAKAALGLTADIIKNPPSINKCIPVRIFLAGPGSMLPDWMKLPFESNRMAYEFAAGKPNVKVIDLRHGGHDTPGEYPDEVIATIVGSK